MNIAVGNSRMDKVFVNKDMTWDDFKNKCSKTVRTTETMAEYRKLSKAKQDNIKDVGGFVMGILKNGKRKNGFVLNRTAITLDLDHAVKDVWDVITMLEDFECLMYSTHKHTTDNPRVRLIIPLSRPVSADEYPAVSRMVAKDIGMEMVDDTCHEAARLMYWPSTSSDGQFLFETQSGAFLNPDDVLNRYTDWRDSTLWPVSSRQSEIVKRTIAKQANPLEKEGIVGAFCRTYSISNAIDTFLPDVYKPSSIDGRYDYVPADSSAGVVLYDDKFVYSHHASDPASGHLLNAFDVVRIHKFSHLDDKTKSDTAPTKRPSYKAMTDVVLKDEKVKETLAKEREQRLQMDFADETNWKQKLEINKKGEIEDTVPNFELILRFDDNLQGIVFNENTCSIDVKEDSKLPWKRVRAGWSDNDMASLVTYIAKVYNIFSPTKLKNAFLSVVNDRAYNPVKEYLEGLPQWDGTERVDRLLIDYLGAEDNPYTRAVTRKTLVAAVSRIYKPGTKFDYILTLVGGQGIGKSTFFSKLGMKWFSDSLSISDMKDKTGSEKLQGYWILELSELNGMKKMDVETVKSFISRTDDKYRPSYGTVVESHPRQCVIVGTTNATGGFLRDVTGNRRFWPVDVTGNSINKPWELCDTKQIWAEVLYRYHQGEKLLLESDVATYAYGVQQEALENDDREGLIREYLEKPLPDNWKDMDLFSRRVYLSGEDVTSAKGSTMRDRVCTLELWAECFSKDPASMRKTDSYELNGIMRKIEGWQKYEGNKSGRVRFPIYGPQYAYERCDKS